MDINLSTDPKSVSMAFARSPLGGSKSCAPRRASPIIPCRSPRFGMTTRKQTKQRAQASTTVCKLRSSIGPRDDRMQATLHPHSFCGGQQGQQRTFGGVRFVQKMEWLTWPAAPGQNSAIQTLSNLDLCREAMLCSAKQKRPSRPSKNGCMCAQILRSSTCWPELAARCGEAPWVYLKVTSSGMNACTMHTYCALRHLLCDKRRCNPPMHQRTCCTPPPLNLMAGCSEMSLDKSPLSSAAACCSAAALKLEM